MEDTFIRDITCKPDEPFFIVSLQESFIHKIYNSRRTFWELAWNRFFDYSSFPVVGLDNVSIVLDGYSLFAEFFNESRKEKVGEDR